MQSSSRWPRRFQKLGLIGLLLLVLNFTYQIYYRYIAKSAYSSPCQLAKKSCIVAIAEGQRLEFDIQPRPFTNSQTSTLTVRLRHLNPATVTLTLTPVGQVSYAQTITMTALRSDHYAAKIQLDRVMPGHPQWLALVRLHTPTQTLTFPFKFTTEV